MAKRHLYIFNPEHDLALANGEANYMAPASARRMAEELALLPAWYAGKDSAVLASSAYNLSFLENNRSLLLDDVNLLTPPEIASEIDLEPIPWGWDPALRKRLLSLGMDERQLPSLEYLDDLRELSHRIQAVKLLPKLQLNEFFCGESFYLQTQDECRLFVEERKACLLKAPLSGSGKGLNWCKGEFTPFISGWCTRVILSQGGVVGEPIYNKVKDFAMEFYSDGNGCVAFEGYSLFNTGGSGMYDGNILFTDERIAALLSTYVPESVLSELRICLEKELSLLIGSFYRGYLGVDMMVCRFTDETTFRIHPCVEINLRMNMGVVAHCLAKRYLSAGTEGEFRIAYYPSDGLALQEHEQMESTYPLNIENGRIVSGYQPLVPVTKGSHYRAWIRCFTDENEDKCL